MGNGWDIPQTQDRKHTTNHLAIPLPRSQLQASIPTTTTDRQLGPIRIMLSDVIYKWQRLNTLLHLVVVLPPLGPPCQTTGCCASTWAVTISSTRLYVLLPSVATMSTRRELHWPPTPTKRWDLLLPLSVPPQIDEHIVQEGYPGE